MFLEKNRDRIEKDFEEFFPGNFQEKQKKSRKEWKP